MNEWELPFSNVKSFTVAQDKKLASFPFPFPFPFPALPCLLPSIFSLISPFFTWIKFRPSSTLPSSLLSFLLPSTAIEKVSLFSVSHSLPFLRAEKISSLFSFPFPSFS